MTATILLDMDDTLYESSKMLAELFIELHPRLQPIDLSDTRGTLKQLDPERFAAAQQIMALPGLFTTYEPAPGAQLAVDQMRSAGYDVAVCSAPYTSNSSCDSDKRKSLREHFDAELSNTAIFTIDKSRALGDILVDDKPNHVLRRPPTWTQVYYTMPRNADLPGHRVDSWLNWQEPVERALFELRAA